MFVAPIAVVVAWAPATWSPRRREPSPPIATRSAVLSAPGGTVRTRRHHGAVNNRTLPRPGSPVPLADDPDLRIHSAHAEALAAEILTLVLRLVADRNTFLIIDVGSPDRYVQVLTHDGSRVWAETVGDRFLPSDAPLTPDQVNRLVRLGWEPPAVDGFGNWTRCWEHVDLAELAQLLTLTLVTVHHLTDPSKSTVTACSASPPSSPTPRVASSDDADADADGRLPGRRRRRRPGLEMRGRTA